MGTKTSGKSDTSLAKAMAQIDQIRRKISAMDLVCTGTVSRRMMKCGKSSCRCHRDSSARHGPYYEWTRMEGGRFVNTKVSASEAKVLGRGIRNYKQILRLLKRWSRASARLIRAECQER